MPTTYAHFRLGESVAEALPASIRETVCNHKELFQIGVHGPDIFFYHRTFFIYTLYMNCMSGTAYAP